MRLQLPIEALALSLVLAAPAAAQTTTWIVDDDAGPGVDFTDLPPAITAAGPFDTILVLPGTYSSTTVSKGVRIIGSDGARVRSQLRAVDVPAHQTLVAAGLEVWAPFSTPTQIVVRRCDGPVILEDLTAVRLEVDASSDVRMQRVEAMGALTSAPNRIVSSRVELVDCVLRGTMGDELSCSAGDGDRGLVVDSSFVHVAVSDIAGGEGGWCSENVIGCCGGGGTGGTGLFANDSRIVLTGATGAGSIAGGTPGGTWEITGTGTPGTGDEGVGADVSGTAASMPSLRVSDFAITGDPARLVGPNVAVTNTSGDPILRLAGPVQAGVPLPIEIFGTPGHAAQLDFGRSAQVAPLAGSPVEVLTSAQRQAALGAMPADGRKTLALNIPSQWPSGTLFYLQVRITDPATGAVRMSNSAAIVVR